MFMWTIKIISVQKIIYFKNELQMENPLDFDMQVK